MLAIPGVCIALYIISQNRIPTKILVYVTRDYFLYIRAEYLCLYNSIAVKRTDEGTYVPDGMVP